MCFCVRARVRAYACVHFLSVHFMNRILKGLINVENVFFKLIVYYAIV